MRWWRLPRCAAWLERLPNLPRVDVLITTYNEKEPILMRTIVGALGIEFPGVRVWVLDDGNRPWLEAFAGPAQNRP
jgi:cellulose synthase (UDP-forming)